MNRLGVRLVLSHLLAVLVGVSRNIMVTGLFSGVLMFTYFVVMEATQGRTLAKSLLGLRVRGPKGAAKPSFRQSAIRSFACRNSNLSSTLPGSRSRRCAFTAGDRARRPICTWRAMTSTAAGFIPRC